LLNAIGIFLQPGDMNNSCFGHSKLSEPTLSII